jgi:hypothetical protein
MLGLIVISFPFMHVDLFLIKKEKRKKEKEKEFDARFLLKFSAISCIFICFDNSLCLDRNTFIWLRF